MGLRTFLGLKKPKPPPKRAAWRDDPELKAWFSGKEFTSDWVSRRVAKWRNALSLLQVGNPEILEIGSWEGRSAVVLLNILPSGRLLSIDPQVPYSYDLATSEREGRLRRNLQEFGDRVEFSTEFSVPALIRLIAERRFFDVIYIDGDHDREPTLADSLYAWTLLRKGGVMIWDDYGWERETMPPEKRPEQAIDWFLKTFDGQYAVIDKGYQVIIQRTEPNKMATA